MQYIIDFSLELQIKVDGDVDVELFQIIAIPVEYNTISDEAQGGQFV